jgi:membrane-associated phospholipid phosphatase
MNPFDVHVLLWFNGLMSSKALASTVLIVQNNDLIKDAPIIAALWWAWFQGDNPNESDRIKRLISIIAFSIFAVFLARGLALVLPFRVRPLNAELEGFRTLAGLGEHAFVRWSAFPSDNAVLFSCLVAGIWSVSRRLGVFAGVYFLVFVCLPRLIAGIHWPTDLIGGSLIGLALAWVALRPRVYMTIGGFGLSWLERAKGPAYALLFLVTFQLARLFDESIDIVYAISRAIGHQIGQR